MEGILRIIQKRLRVALFLADWSLLIFFIKKLLSMRTVRFTISASENNDIENLFMFCYPMSVFQEYVVQYFVVNSIGRVFFFILMSLCSSKYFRLFTWNQVEICFKGCKFFYKLPMRCAASFAKNVVILLWVHAFNCMFLQMYMLILIIRF